MPVRRVNKSMLSRRSIQQKRHVHRRLRPNRSPMIYRERRQRRNSSWNLSCRRSSLRSREAILMGESEGRRLDDIIEAGTVSGWHSFEQSLGKAYEQNLITAETALNIFFSGSAESRAKGMAWLQRTQLRQTDRDEPGIAAG